MSKTKTTTDKGTENERDGNSCCGGPAPTNANACCARDADAKAAGATGCGCSPATDSKQVCCA